MGAPDWVIAPADGPFEAEADAIAAAMMGSGAVPSITATPSSDGLQRKAAGPSGSDQAGSSVRATLRSPGVPIESSARQSLESRLGFNFANVRIHADAEAARAAHDVSAAAFTVGNHIAFAPGLYAPHTREGRRLLAHELAHVMQQSNVTRSIGPNAGLLQRQPAGKNKTGDTSKTDASKQEDTRFQYLFVVRDTRLNLGGGTMVKDLEELKSKLKALKPNGDWTLVLAVHGSEERLGAQSPPDWQKDAEFYKAADIEKLFNADKEFVAWRTKYGPTALSLVACQVSKSFEGTLINNLTRAPKGASRQESRGLGKGCKPIASTKTFDDAPATKAEFLKMPVAKQNDLLEQMETLNDEWGYYGAPPVPASQLLHYYYDEAPKRAWVVVEVMVGTGHEVKDLTPTGIPYWNRTVGDKAAEFRRVCDQGAAPMRGHTPAVPDVPEGGL